MAHDPATRPAIEVRLEQVNLMVRRYCGIISSNRYLHAFIFSLICSSLGFCWLFLFFPACFKIIEFALSSIEIDDILYFSRFHFYFYFYFWNLEKILLLSEDCVFKIFYDEGLVQI